MGKMLVAMAALGLCACQPMYGAKPDKVKNPSVVRHVPTADPPPVPKVYIDDCQYKVVSTPKPPKRDIPRAEESTRRGDAALGTFEKASDTKSKTDMLIDSVQQYGNALEKDPFSAEATLKLARAYDVAQRKGCALRLLGRLAKLAENPTFEKKANEQLDEIQNHKAWFEDYRKDALQAAGR